MLFNSHISAADVKAYLRTLARGSVPQRSPLARLNVVTQKLEADGLSGSSAARDYELARIILNAAESKLDELRTGLAPHSNPDIRTDFASGNHYLEAWSALYHIYLRQDLNLTLGTATALLGDRHRRTVQRRLSLGVQLLTVELLRLERLAIRHAHRLALLAQLPPRPPAYLTRGPEHEILDLLRGPTPVNIYLVGPRGVGKRTTAIQVTNELARQEIVDHVTWQNHDLTTPERTTTGPLPVTVIQGSFVRAGDPGGVPDPVGKGKDHPGHTLTIAVSAGPTNARVIHIRPLRHSDSRVLLQRLLTLEGITGLHMTPPQSVNTLCRLTQGLPLAISLAASQLRTYPVHRVISQFENLTGSVALMVTELHGAAWQSLEKTSRALLECVAFECNPWWRFKEAVPEGGCNVRALTDCIELGFILPSLNLGQRKYRLAPFVTEFVKMTCPDALATRTAFSPRSGASRIQRNGNAGVNSSL